MAHVLDRGARAVHRPLHLTSPLMDGADVRALQSAVKKGLAHYKVDWLPLSIDGQLGRQTLHAARFYAWILGAPEATRRNMQAGTIGEPIQRILRTPIQRGRLYRLRASRRKARLGQIRKAQHSGPKAAVAYARDFIGTTENPPESNTGPTITKDGRRGGITFWESYWGLGACYWCLVFAVYCVKAIGGARVDGLEGDSNPVNAEVIERMAKEHAHGWVAVPLGQERAGDISLWCFNGSGVPEHGELVVGPFDGHSNDIGGNTSSGPGGSQSNGGGVFARTDRPLAELTCIARSLYS